MRDTAAAVSAHHDQVHCIVPSVVHDCPCWRSEHHTRGHMELRFLRRVQQCLQLGLRLLAPGFPQSGRNVAIDVGCVGSRSVWIHEDVNEMNRGTEFSSQGFRGCECSFGGRAEISRNEKASEPPGYGVLPV